MTTKWCQARFSLPASERARANNPYLPADGARCALPELHAGDHMFARAEPLPEAIAAMHIAPPVKSRAELRRDVAFVSDHMLQLRIERELARLGYTHEQIAESCAFTAGYLAGYRAREADERGEEGD